MLTSEILDKAADVIERNGWYVGSFVPRAEGDQRPLRERPCCVLAALGIAEHGDPYRESAADETFARHLDLADDWDETETEVGDRLGYWNDADGRTAEQVVRELRAAAASEREAGR